MCQAQSRHQTPWHQMKIACLFSISRIGDIIQKGKNTPSGGGNERQQTLLICLTYRLFDFWSLSGTVSSRLSWIGDIRGTIELDVQLPGSQAKEAVPC
jgi:hypothetical protein